MGLTFRDAITSALAAAVVAVTYAVTQELAWPMLATPRAGILVLGALGITMCVAGTRTEDMATGEELKRHPGMIVGAALGGLALVIWIVGMFTGTETALMALAVVLIALWATATIRHALAPTHERPATHGTLAGVH
jgi:hypothetical protein